MKQLYSIVLGVFISVNITTAQNNSLIIYSQEGIAFTVILNGVRQNMQPETNVKITSLNAPNYQVKLIFANNMADLNQTVYLLNGGENTTNTEYSYGLSKVKEKYKLRFKSAAPIVGGAAPVAQQNVVVYSASPSTTTTTTTAPISTTTSTTSTTTNTMGTTTINGNDNGGSVGVNMPGVGINVNINAGTGTNTANPNTISSTTTTSTITSTTGTNTTGTTNNAAVTTSNTNANNCAIGMSSGNFEAAKKSIQAKNFDDSKLTIAKQILDANCLKCSQIKELMGLFSFEASKLEIAKYAWHRVIDKANYFTINDAFTFDSSVDELNEYTKSH
jgi:hypothetical protein